METLLSVKNLTKRYPDFVLDHFNLEIPAGTVVGFIGENGAGKTTAIKTMLDITHRDEGEVSVFGEPFTGSERHLKQKIGTAFDTLYFYQHFTVSQIEKIMVGCDQNFDRAYFAKLIQRFNLPLKQAVKSFSKGMLMKLNIILALARRPRLLILDEPTSGLDPIARDEILDIFRDFIQDEQHAVLFSSHITSDIEHIADYVAFIHQGKRVFMEEKDQLLENAAIVKFTGSEGYLGREWFVGTRSNAFGKEALTLRATAFKKAFPQVLTSKATLEDIMLYYIKGEK